jgi:hypothetical protein
MVKKKISFRLSHTQNIESRGEEIFPSYFQLASQNGTESKESDLKFKVHLNKFKTDKLALHVIAKKQ